MSWTGGPPLCHRAQGRAECAIPEPSWMGTAVPVVLVPMGTAVPAVLRPLPQRGAGSRASTRDWEGAETGSPCPGSRGRAGNAAAGLQSQLSSTQPASPARRRHSQQGSSPTPHPVHPGWANKAPRLQSPGLSSTPASAPCVNSPNQAQRGQAHRALQPPPPSRRPTGLPVPLPPACSQPHPRGGCRLGQCGWALPTAVSPVW